MHEVKAVLDSHGATIKHGIDAVAIPSGLVATMAHYMGTINDVMTFLVLLTSLVWGVYRIIDMRNTQRRVKRQ